jgi:hypothetical protein
MRSLALALPCGLTGAVLRLVRRLEWEGVERCRAGVGSWIRVGWVSIEERRSLVAL